MVRIDNVLLATDLSEASDDAFLYARTLARSCHATLHLLYVAEDLLTRYDAGVQMMLSADVQRELEDDARKQLERLASQAAGDAPVRAVLRTSNATAAAVTDYARDAAIDLIVLGTHGRRGVSHLLLGSVAERVSRTAPCPVLIVRHPEHQVAQAKSTAAA
jgi:nucleotide-binding universal stress UspA family protein